MATEGRHEQAKDFTELVPTGPQDLAALGGPIPIAPQGITEEDPRKYRAGPPTW